MLNTCLYFLHLKVSSKYCPLLLVPIFNFWLTGRIVDVLHTVAMEAQTVTFDQEWVPASMYTACYCEENVYKLLERANAQDASPSHRWFAAFISNPSKTTAILKQRSTQRANGMVIWD